MNRTIIQVRNHPMTSILFFLLLKFAIKKQTSFEAVFRIEDCSVFNISVDYPQLAALSVPSA